MKLPNSERAVIDPQKLISYSLDPTHDEGRHKTRLFASVLGITSQNANLLLGALEQAALVGDAAIGKIDKYGQRYLIDFTFPGPAGTAAIRSAWIVRDDEDFPRLVTCYIL